MAFTEGEKKLITHGRATGKTPEQIESAINKLRQGFVPPAPTPNSLVDYVDPVKLLDAGAGIVESGFGKINEVASKANQFLDTTLGGATPEQARATDERSKGMVETVTAPIAGALNLLPEPVKDAVTIGSVLVPGGRAIGAAPLKAGATAVGNAAKTLTGPVGEALAPVTDVLGSAGAGVARIPSRIATNLAEKKASELSIKSLPTKISQTAVRDGIELADVKALPDIVKSQKPFVKELITGVQKFARGESNVDPIALVGKPLVSNLKNLEKQRATVGAKLGEASKNLGEVTRAEMEPAVMQSLQKVPGLQGVVMGTDGLLDFTNTTIAKSSTSADRAAIQQAFNDAVESGTGAQKHMYRQELFEVLDGKKKSLSNITDTQDKALNAIRGGISDVLESKNPQYKTLSNEYRKIVQPLSDMRKFMKTIPEATEDILDMQAGILARRLTSTAASRPTIEALLKRIDDATAVKGTARSDSLAAQNLYNILNKYYDIAPKTGFQGQVKGALDGGSGVVDMATNAIKGLAGETTAVRQKALEQLLQELTK